MEKQKRNQTNEDKKNGRRIRQVGRKRKRNQTGGEKKEEKSDR